MIDINTIEQSRDEAVLETASRDISHFKLVPQAVFYPKNTAEVQAVVLHAQREGVPVSVRAGGTCMSGGSLTTGFMLDLTKYMHDVVIDVEAKTATVGAGAYFRDIEDAAKIHNLFFAGYPSSNRICGIGGMLGNNASGEKSLRHGGTGVNTLELEVVLANGTITTLTKKALAAAVTEREQAVLVLAQQHGSNLKQAIGDVKKCASGYRLDAVVADGMFSEIPLMVGAQGTLGIITKATLRLEPLPAHTALYIISATSLEQLPDIVSTVDIFHPEGLETFDKNTFARARVFLAEYAERVVPYIDEQAELFILAQFAEETAAGTAAMAEACFRELQAKGYRVAKIEDETDVTSAWMVRRNSFTLMRDHNAEGFKAVPCIEDVIVPLPALGEFIHELIGILTRRNITYGFHGHIGDGSFRVVPVFDLRHENVLEEVYGLMDETFALIKRLRGNMSADHSDGIIRTPFLESFYGPELTTVFATIKKIYDPEHRFNRGKKVGGTKEMIAASIVR